MVGKYFLTFTVKIVKLGLLIGWRVGMLVLALLVHVKCSGGWGSSGCGRLVRPQHVTLNLHKFSLTALYGGTGDQVVCTPIQFGALLAPTQDLQILVLHPLFYQICNPTLQGFGTSVDPTLYLYLHLG